MSDIRSRAALTEPERHPRSRGQGLGRTELVSEVVGPKLVPEQRKRRGAAVGDRDGLAVRPAALVSFRVVLHACDLQIAAGGIGAAIDARVDLGCPDIAARVQQVGAVADEAELGAGAAGGREVRPHRCAPTPVDRDGSVGPGSRAHEEHAGRIDGRPVRQTQPVQAPVAHHPAGEVHPGGAVVDDRDVLPVEVLGVVAHRVRLHHQSQVRLRPLAAERRVPHVLTTRTGGIEEPAVLKVVDRLVLLGHPLAQPSRQHVGRGIEPGTVLLLHVHGPQPPVSDGGPGVGCGGQDHLPALDSVTQVLVGAGTLAPGGTRILLGSLDAEQAHDVVEMGQSVAGMREADRVAVNDHRGVTPVADGLTGCQGRVVGLRGGRCENPGGGQACGDEGSHRDDGGVAAGHNYHFGIPPPRLRLHSPSCPLIGTLSRPLACG